jgi:AraC-like DNA-binding protein
VTEHIKPVALQRAASLVPLTSLLGESGISLDAVLHGTGVTPDQLRPDAFIPYAAYLAILDAACTLTGREDIGIVLGRRQTLAALGPLGTAMRHAATLGQALADFAAFQRHNSTGGAVYLLRADHDVILGYGVYDDSARVSPLVYDLVLAVGCNLIAELSGGAAGPEEILLSRTMPADPSPWLRLGRCPVRFGQNQTGLLLKQPILALPLPASDRALHDQALARLSPGTGGQAPDCSGQVRHLLRPRLLTGQAGMHDLAALLNIHPRALRRHLRREGTTFAAIRDQVRNAAARELLMLGDLGIADIALTLGYADASAFVTAFRRWNGLPPGLWRRGATATADPAG